jgi:hypothetical protein
MKKESDEIKDGEVAEPPDKPPCRGTSGTNEENEPDKEPERARRFRKPGAAENRPWRRIAALGERRES